MTARSPAPMTFALADALAGVPLPRALLPREQAEHLVAAAGDIRFPCQWGMVEVRLDSPAPPDLLACVCELDGHREALATLPEPAAPRAVRAWTHGTNPAQTDAPQLWLEWDRADVSAEPLSWWGVDPGFYDPRRSIPPDQQAELAIAACGASGGRRAALRSLAAAIGPRGRLLGVGSLQTRGIDRLRVFFRMPRSEAAAALAAWRWPGDLRAAAAWVDQAVPHLEPACLQVEIDDAPGPYLGVEAPQWERTNSHHRGWGRALVDAGLADARRVEAALAWPGRTVGRFTTSLHLKVTVGQGASAKAYLGVRARGADASPPPHRETTGCPR